MTPRHAKSHLSAAITGVGVVAPLGVGVDSFWEHALRGDDVIRDAESPRGAPVPTRAMTLGAMGFDPEDSIAPRVIRRFSRFSTLAVIAAAEAVESAGLSRSETPESFESSGVALGTAYGSSDYHFEYYEGLYRHGLKEASPLLFSESVLNAASGHITQHTGLPRPGWTLVGGEEAGLNATAAALDFVRSGDGPFCLGGGAEEYCEIVHATLGAWEVVGATAGAPYTHSGDLSVVGEGAGFLVVEDPLHASTRGAPARAFVRGAAARRCLRGGALKETVAEAVRAALDDAQVDADAVDLVVGGGSGGTPLERSELDGMRAVIPESRALIYSAPKKLVGEAFGFSSAAQAVVAVQAIATGTLPLTSSPEASMLPGEWRFSTAGESVSIDTAIAIAVTRRGNATAVVFSQNG